MGVPWRHTVGRPRTERGTRSIAAGHGCERGVWPRRMAYRQTHPDRAAVRRDSAVARQRTGAEPALGRRRGGFGPQIRMRADRRGRPLRVTNGPRRDSTQARPLVEACTKAPRSCPITDWIYDGDAFRAWLAQKSSEAVIPVRPPPPTTRNGIRRAMPWNEASAGSNAGDACPPAGTHTRRGSWVFCTWQGLGSG